MRRAHARGFAILLTTFALVGGSTAVAPAAFAVPAAEITIEVTPEATEGETVEVVASATGAVDLYAYDLVFEYDPTLLEFDADSLSGPGGGFSAASAADGIVTIAHTRLGASPGLSGDIEIGRFTFTVLGGGDTEIALSSSTLVGAAEDTVTLTAVDAAPVALVALADPDPTSTPSTSPSTSPSPDANVAGEIDQATGRPLAATGSDGTPWLVGGAVGAVLLALGALLVIRRHRAVTE